MILSFEFDFGNMLLVQMYCIQQMFSHKVSEIVKFHLKYNTQHIDSFYLQNPKNRAKMEKTVISRRLGFFSGNTSILENKIFCD